MSKIKLILIPLVILIVLSFSCITSPVEVTVISDVSIPSTDGLNLKATLYVKNNASAPFIVLCHRAKWSRGEYLELGPKLNDMGFNCLAIDQRSGDEVNGVKNETALKAREKALETRYIDALPDIRSALDYVEKTFRPTTLLLWGSSYSAALSLVCAAERPKQIDGVIAFSPGEYFSKQGKTKTWITESAAGVKSPVFITAKNKEKGMVEPIFKAVPSEDSVLFIPETEGKHGSEALYKTNSDNDAYWAALIPFLQRFL